MIVLSILKRVMELGEVVAGGAGEAILSYTFGSVL
jgi:hypothetical protein